MDIGTHIVADIFVDKLVFDNILHKNFFVYFDDEIQSYIVQNDLKLLNKIIHFFDGPVGAFTALYLLSESHLSFHSWPEYNYIAVDIFTCGKSNPEIIITKICTFLEAKKVNIRKITRSVPG